MAGEVDGTTTSFGKPSLHIRRYLALTDTYGNFNKGNGRPGRRARYLEGVKFSPFIYEFAG